MMSYPQDTNNEHPTVFMLWMGFGWLVFMAVCCHCNEFVVVSLFPVNYHGLVHRHLYCTA